MSEFKVGDWVKMKDDSSAWMGKVAAIEYKPCFDSKWNRYEIEILVFEDGTKLGSGWAIHVVKAAGHRIDKTIGTLEELHPEFSKVLHENFLELLGDDAHIENHISPHCQSKDV
ncbi:TPA: hypothetical protein OMQ77_000332 [Acinetobacter baumannii]|uniref:hypothetical protein n=1 Tax=Acinetobacter baumannii TaxID=470 RepID=UPI0006277384|nr:hypothetical protein [Acinetobacter baumannii]WCF71449.1 hypothetical protein Acba3_041 [Acinetobacter phage Acba_3]WCF71744.1 hypothetical protein ACBA13_009 [Acinetobacter phage Acba_13]EKW2380154.1 hypothetical protein [Acinetobacter baumannii]KKI95532.1 hypothetical protein WQ50_12590 [Acinetobacter baumannii]TPS49755.1 hypothetical protein FJU82_07095 [Acinetobacter baumannii]